MEFFPFKTRTAYLIELLPAEGVPGKWEALSPELPNRSAKPATEDQIFSGKFLLTRLSFSHLELLSALDVPLKRSFYEVECIKGNWSVRELKRQIAKL